MMELHLVLYVSRTYFVSLFERAPCDPRPISTLFTGRRVRTMLIYLCLLVQYFIQVQDLVDDHGPGSNFSFG